MNSHYFYFFLLCTYATWKLAGHHGGHIPPPLLWGPNSLLLCSTIPCRYWGGGASTATKRIYWHSLAFTPIITLIIFLAVGIILTTRHHVPCYSNSFILSLASTDSTSANISTTRGDSSLFYLFSCRYNTGHAGIDRRQPQWQFWFLSSIAGIYRNNIGHAGINMTAFILIAGIDGNHNIIYPFDRRHLRQQHWPRRHRHDIRGRAFYSFSCQY